MIRLVWLLCWFGLANVGSAAPAEEWRRSPKPIREAVRATVEAQLTAIRENNFALAHKYAASGIRQRFTPAVFAAMIRRGYPALVRHVQADVGSVRDDGQQRAQVSVTVFDPLHRATSYRYFLIEEEDGWKIEGVATDVSTPRKEI